MNPLLLMLVTALPEAPGPPSPPQTVKRIALVIGENSAPSPKDEPLSYADDDAVQFARLLQNAGVQPHLLVQLDEESARLHETSEPEIIGPPTLSRVRAQLKLIREKLRQAKLLGLKTEFYFVYSGHGDVENGEGFAGLSDGKLTRRFLTEEVLAQSPADRNHVIIDACRSYFLVFSKGPGGHRKPHSGQLASARSRFRNTGFVLSTSSDRESHEWARFQAGIFSYEVRSGLRGAADLNRDRNISYAEMGAFIRTANAEIKNAKYRPDEIVLPPITERSDTPLLTWRGSVHTLLLPGQNPGRLYIEDNAGLRLADAHPAQNQKLTMHLPGHRPLFVRVPDQGLEARIETRGPVRLHKGLFMPISVQAKGAAHLAFQKLFKTPLSQSAVAQYRAELDGSALELTIASTPATPARTAGTVLAWTSVGVGLLGGSMSLGAYLDRRANLNSMDNNVIYASNRRITRYNVAAVSSYITAGALIVSWLSIELYHLLQK